MEPYCAKSVLLNLVHEHELRITSFTTDRSTSVKTAVRLIFKDFVQNILIDLLFSELETEMPVGFPVIIHYYDIWHFIKVLSILFELK